MQLYLQFERTLAEAELARIRPLVKRRSQREPLQYILGEIEWCGLNLKVDRRALIPRPETERLVEIIEGMLSEAPARILDLGTGSGAIALALAKRYPTAEVVAIDTSEEALTLARENAVSAGLVGRVNFLKSDWFASLPAGSLFDLIVSNPPYLTAEELAAAEPEVKTHEPVAALVADEEGVADLRRIIEYAPAFMKKGGLLAMETGIAHHAELLRRSGESGFARAESHRDLTGRDRFVLAWP